MLSRFIPGQGCAFQITRPALYDRVYNCHRLYFKDETRGDFHIRGAVKWPEGTNKGFMVVAGQHVKTGTVCVFRQYAFYTLQDEIILDVDKGLPAADHGFLNMAEVWIKLFGCKKYFTESTMATDDVWYRFIVDVVRAQGYKYKPSFIPVRITDKSVIDNVIFEMSRLGQFRVRKNSAMHFAIEAFRVGNIGSGDVFREEIGDESISFNTGIDCLRILLSGYHTMPYKQPKITKGSIKTKMDVLRIRI